MFHDLKLLDIRRKTIWHTKLREPFLHAIMIPILFLFHGPLLMILAPTYGGTLLGPIGIYTQRKESRIAINDAKARLLVSLYNLEDNGGVGVFPVKGIRDGELQTAPRIERLTTELILTIDREGRIPAFKGVRYKYLGIVELDHRGKIKTSGLARPGQYWVNYCKRKGISTEQIASVLKNLSWTSTLLGPST